MIALNEEIVKRARDIMEHSNIKAFDSLHLASAEQTADFLLTTDIKFLKACRSLDINVTVKNPVDFVLEVEAAIIRKKNICSQNILLMIF